MLNVIEGDAPQNPGIFRRLFQSHTTEFSPVIHASILYGKYILRGTAYGLCRTNFSYDDQSVETNHFTEQY